MGLNDLSSEGKKYQSEKWLRSKYWKEGMTLEEIADVAGVSHETIRVYMESNSIERRNFGRNKNMPYHIRDEILNLYDDGYSIDNIVEETGVSYNKVWQIVPRDRIRGKSDHNIQDINTDDDVNMSYFIGVMMGDGWRYMHGRAHVIGMGATDKDFVWSFKECLENIGVRTHTRTREARTDNHKDMYEVKCISLSLYKWCSGISSDKDRINKILFSNKDTMREFLRGFYESEGNLNYKGNGVNCSVSNTNSQIMDIVEGVYVEYGFNPNRYRYSREDKGNKDIELIMISKKEEVERFIEYVSPITKNRLEEYER